MPVSLACIKDARDCNSCITDVDVAKSIENYTSSLGPNDVITVVKKLVSSEIVNDLTTFASSLDLEAVTETVDNLLPNPPP